jgi:hypothetical protein
MRTIAVSGLIALTALLGAGASAAVAGSASAAPTRASVAATPDNQLFGVSCASTSDCVAVGNNQSANGNEGGPLVQTWNGKSWKTVGVKLPAKAISGELVGVSCPSATACVAVGLWLNAGDTGFPLAETWNGRTWTPSTLVAGPKGSTAEFINGVSCTSAKNCMAVGDYVTFSGTTALAEHWNGKTWTVSKPPVPAHSVVGDLDGVSCPSATRCIAVGTSATNSGGFVLADAWNGKTWSRMSVTPPASSKNDAVMTGVSCSSATNCVGVGSGTAATGRPGGLSGFTERWNGKTWTAGKVSWPKGTSNSYLVGASCRSATSCMVVGYVDINVNDGGNTGRAAAARWNGKTWTATSVPAPGKGKASLFSAVSCPSATVCVAAGQLSPFKSTEGSGLAGRWNGKSWNLVSTPVAG